MRHIFSILVREDKSLTNICTTKCADGGGFTINIYNPFKFAISIFSLRTLPNSSYYPPYDKDNPHKEHIGGKIKDSVDFFSTTFTDHFIHSDPDSECVGICITASIGDRRKRDPNESSYVMEFAYPYGIQPPDDNLIMNVKQAEFKQPSPTKYSTPTEDGDEIGFVQNEWRKVFNVYDATLKPQEVAM